MANAHTPDTRHADANILLAAMQTSRMPMVVSDPSKPDTPIAFCNDAFCELTGYASDEVIGRNCRFLQGPLTDAADLQRLREHIAAGREIHVELFNYRKDGTGFWNALYVSPVFGPQGELLCFFGSQLDVTSRREAEAVLHQAQRMDTLGAMASGIAHEFNNLMTVVIASVEQASARAVDPRQLVQLERAATGARRAGRLTSQMLSFARRQYLEASIVDLNAAVRDIDRVLAKTAGTQAQFEVQLAPEPLLVRIDVAQFHLALVNLVRNAGEAVRERGTVLVSTSSPSGGVTVGLSVRDDGVGMDATTASRAVEPFFTTKPSGQGAGLGLSMTHGFVGQSGGTMEIESAVDHGTEVRLSFPAVAA